jgi:DNA polymerase-1
LEKDKLLIIDLSNFIFRAFYGIGPLANKEGFPTGAIYGVANMFMTMLNEIKPSHVIIAVDSQTRKERKDLYEEYKSNRSSPPDDLKTQIPIIQEMLNLMNFTLIESVGFEADDVIGTAVNNYKDEFNSIYIASGDKDLMQLVEKNVVMYDSMKNKIFNTKAVVDKFGIEPSKMIEFLALVGDKSDNVPGVAGIGPKGAVTLLTQFDTVESIYENIELIESKNIKNKLEKNKELALISKKLVTIEQGLELSCDIDKCIPNLHINSKLNDFLIKYQLFSIIKKIKML